jgi:glycosyl transferase, family 25
MTATFIINLEYRKDRRREMESQLRQVGWQAEFFKAVQPDSADAFPSVGARGCFLSHLAILKMAREKNLERLIILEDDFNFSSDFSAKWPNIEQFLREKDCALFYPAPARLHADQSILEIDPEQGLMCTHFIVFDRSAISKSIEGLEAIMSRPSGHPLGGPMHVDAAYSLIRKQNPELKTYAHFPPLGCQRPSRTDVGEGHWLDRVGAFRPVATGLRKLKKTFLKA